ncbi:MAG: hypothetical protein WCI67_08930, partial [Chloroflexales bacterium]
PPTAEAPGVVEPSATTAPPTAEAPGVVEPLPTAKVEPKVAELQPSSKTYAASARDTRNAKQEAQANYEMASTKAKDARETARKAKEEAKELKKDKLKSNEYLNARKQADDLREVADKAQLKADEAKRLMDEAVQRAELANQLKIIDAQDVLAVEKPRFTTENSLLEAKIEEKLSEIEKKKKLVADDLAKWEPLSIKYNKLKGRAQTEKDLLNAKEDFDKAYKKYKRREKETRQLESERNELLHKQRKLREQLEALERETKGISPEEYEFLRSRTPDSTLRKKARSQVYDEIYGRIMEQPSADHIVSVNEICQMDNFAALKEEDKLFILNEIEENIMYIEKSVNSSKGDRTFSLWKGHPDFPDIPTDRRNILINREQQARQKIQDTINELYNKAIHSTK